MFKHIVGKLGRPNRWVHLSLIKFPACQAGGREFKSRHSRHENSSLSVHETGFFVMSYHVYIIKSLKDGSYYVGSTQNLAKRMERHNQGKNYRVISRSRISP